ncbi:hypothetical protein FACS189472_00750 [Alphaproteobacteria bacterium]|nr:hypothetical protein FACS189472_00750 [Alphaproteobacteria bacterium]
MFADPRNVDVFCFATDNKQNTRPLRHEIFFATARKSATQDCDVLNVHKDFLERNITCAASTEANSKKDPLYRDLNQGSALVRVGLCAARLSVDSLIEIAEAILDEEDFADFNRFEFPKKRMSYVLGRLSAKLAANEIILKSAIRNIKISNALPGNPILLNENYDLAMAHSGEFGISICHSRNIIVGLDIEHINNFRNRLLLGSDFFKTNSTFFDNTECGKCMLWTVLEAASKYMKIGISANFSIFDISSSKNFDNKYVITELKHFPSILVISFAFKKVVLSICVYKKMDYSCFTLLADNDKIKRLFDEKKIDNNKNASYVKLIHNIYSA